MRLPLFEHIDTDCSPCSEHEKIDTAPKAKTERWTENMQNEFRRCVFLEATSAEHAPPRLLIPCFAIRETLAYADLETLAQGLPYLKCESCWNAIFDFVLDGHTNEVLPCMKHLTAVSPRCVICCVAFCGYEKIVTDIKNARADSYPLPLIRVAFLGACRARDNVSATCLYAQFVRTIGKKLPLIFDWRMSAEIPLAAKAIRAGQITRLFQDVARVFCDVSMGTCANADQVIAFLASCFFPGDDGVIWRAIDFIEIFNNCGRHDIALRVYHLANL